MSPRDVDAFDRAVAAGHEVRIRAGANTYYATPIEIRDGRVLVIARGARKASVFPVEHVDEVTIAGAASAAV